MYEPNNHSLEPAPGATPTPTRPQRAQSRAAPPQAKAAPGTTAHGRAPAGVNESGDATPYDGTQGQAVSGRADVLGASRGSAPPRPASVRRADSAVAPRSASANGTVKRILVADAFPVLRRGVLSAFDIEPDMDVVGVTSSVEETLAQVVALRPHVLVMEIQIDGDHDMVAIETAARACRGTAIIAVDLGDATETMVAAVDAGAQGYLSINDRLEEFPKAIREVTAGAFFLNPERTAALARFRGRSRSRRTWRDLVSRQELELLRCFARCMTIQQAAHYLKIAPSTVSTYRQRLLNKLELPNTAHLIKFAIEHDVDAGHRNGAPPTNGASLDDDSRNTRSPR